MSYLHKIKNFFIVVGIVLFVIVIANVFLWGMPMNMSFYLVGCEQYNRPWENCDNTIFAVLIWVGVSVGIGTLMLVFEGGSSTLTRKDTGVKKFNSDGEPIN